MNCMEWRPEDRPTFHQISQRLQSYWQSLNDQASPRRQSASSDIPRESIAGLYRSRHSAVSSSETIETEETDVSFENVCSSRFGVIPSYDTMKSDEAMGAIRREFLQFSLNQLLDGNEIKAGEGIYGVVYATNITLIAKTVKVMLISASQDSLPVWTQGPFG